MLLVPVSGYRFEIRYLSPFGTGAHGYFSSSASIRRWVPQRLHGSTWRAEEKEGGGEDTLISAHNLELEFVSLGMGNMQWNIPKHWLVKKIELVSPFSFQNLLSATVIDNI